MIIGGGWQINANGVMVPHYEWDTLQLIGMAGVVALFFTQFPVDMAVHCGVDDLGCLSMALDHL